MRRTSDRRYGITLLVVLLGAAIAAIGCAGIHGHPSPHRYPAGPSGALQGAVLGGMVGAAAGAGIDHRDRGRGALVGGLGGVILGAIFGEQIERHDAWLRAHDAPCAHAHPHDPHAAHPYPCDDPHGHAWPEDGEDFAYDHDSEEHAWEDQADEPYRDSPGEAYGADPTSALGLPEVLFDPGQATLTRGAQARLRHLAQQVRGRDDVEILLRGHSDEREPQGFDLSEARARAVREFLAAEGVSVRRIAWVGFGAAQPVATNETAAGRQRNRRVEIVLRDPEPDPYS